MNILIVDDETGIRELLSTLVRDEINNINIYNAENGEQGNGIEQNIRLDAIVTDYKMPIKDGLEFVNDVRKKGLNRTVPIIFLSAYIPELQELNFVWENVFFLEKPDGMYEMIKYLKKIRQNLKECA